MTQLAKIKSLKLQIEELEKELKIETNSVLEQFRNMSDEDMALNESRLGGDGIVIQYFPKSTITSVDSEKLKEDGLYDKYTKTSNKTDFVKVTLAKGDK